MDCGIVSDKYFTIDASSVPIQCRENNFKASARDRFNKMYPAKADLQAGLGVMVNYLKPFCKRVTYFWEYKNHILSDAISELPLFELTKPADVSEGTLLISMIKKFKEHLEIFSQAVIADAGYDYESSLKFIIHQLKAKPVIARNLRWEKHKEHKLSREGTPICIAGLETIYWGRFSDRRKVRLKYVCPITHSKRYREKYYFCPWNHPNFTKAKRCYMYIRGYDKKGTPFAPCGVLCKPNGYDKEKKRVSLVCRKECLTCPLTVPDPIKDCKYLENECGYSTHMS